VDARGHHRDRAAGGAHRRRIPAEVRVHPERPRLSRGCTWPLWP
jgi:hypothetical protein